MPPGDDNLEQPNEGNPPIVGGTPPKQGTDWESSYKGLQKTYDKLFADHQSLVAKHESTVGELEALKAEKRQGDSSATALQQQIVSKDTEIERLKNEVTVSDRKASRSTLIMSEFSDLAHFEAQSLLPSAETDDELRTRLTKFRETVSKTVGTEVEKKVKGAGPPPVGKQEPPKLDADDIYEQLVRLAGSPTPEDQTEYLKLHKQWLDLQKPS